MTRFDHPILQEVAALGLPHPEDVIINHGAALVIRGVRPERIDGDIDLATCLANIRYLRGLPGWRVVRLSLQLSGSGGSVRVRATRNQTGRFDVHRWDIISRDQTHYRVSVAEQKRHSRQDEVTGLWVATIDYVMREKQALKRPKDSQDIQLINTRTIQA